MNSKKISKQQHENYLCKKSRYITTAEDYNFDYHKAEENLNLKQDNVKNKMKNGKPLED